MSNFNKKKFFKFLKNKKYKKPIVLSKAFGVFCLKIKLENNETFVVKGLKKKNTGYSTIYSEGKSLQFMNKRFSNLFPKVYFLNKNFIIMKYISNNKPYKKNFEKELASIVSKIHNKRNDKFGFNFDTPIGGFRQPCSFQKSWIDFYKNKRLLHIYNEINKTNPMPKKINKSVENIIKNIGNLIPENPKPSLIHGDLWKGNILINNGKIVGLIDPGIYYAHKEMEVAYLKWFNTITNKFYNYYSENIEFDKDFFKYCEVYELYYSLLNVHLWNRNYIHNVAKLVRKFN